MVFLWLARFAPFAPLKGGAFDYSRDLILSLSQRGNVEVLAFESEAVVPPEADSVQWETLPHSDPSQLNSLLSSLPNVAFRNVDRAYLGRVIERAANVDAIFVDFIAMAWLVEPLVKALEGWHDRPPVIMVTHNHEHDVRKQMARNTRVSPMRFALALDAAKAGRLERRANMIADGITAITSSDADAFGRYAQTPTITLPPAYRGPSLQQRTIDANTPRVATVLGNRDAHHKMMVLDRTLSAFAAARLEKAVTIDIAGGGDFSRVSGAYPDFRFSGFVPDIVSYLSGVRLGLMSDDIGGGFKIRAMTYAFLRVPMLALHEAMRGMEFVEGVHFVGADDLADMAAKARLLIDDVDRLNALHEAAFEFAKARFDPASPGVRLSEFVNRLKDSRSAAAKGAGVK